jgi:hypothetical protein
MRQHAVPTQQGEHFTVSTSATHRTLRATARPLEIGRTLRLNTASIRCSARCVVGVAGDAERQRVQ